VASVRAFAKPLKRRSASVDLSVITVKVNIRKNTT